ncbi:putative TetR family transcriptional regulator [Caenibius tardaugens NBRC 16725]|uniref:Putative TetR family transcriptional regulator n=1 Tax=Caenibius tardaugens NBRC 16725 TaxID=1219035 RepID=U2Y8X9_9SPHN|nr:TetR/AcrR family transcriptional regulator [Caenibius tardaugens]AZI37712.1 TetR/AcrR family transcriptional regulator [Caenibius tardaugens NBRC 16725]GAD49731.1 putative TetR family transcriptional regulator [Caenibius tardaugens NBRC 16725]
MRRREGRLPPRDPKGGRPSQELAARLGVHILDIALEQLITHGGDRASMEVIARAANVSKRTLYSRFGSKVDLLYAVIDHGFARIAKPVTRPTAKGSPREQLLSAAKKMLNAALKPETIGHETLIYWAIEHYPRAGTRARADNHAGIQIFRRILDDAAERGELIVQDPEFLSSLLFDALVVGPRHRILRRRTLANTPAAKNEYLEKTLEIVLAGACPPSS